MKKNGENRPEEQRLPIDLRKTIMFFIWSFAVGLIASIMNARNIQSCAISILWMLASLSFGIMIGFLFGIPKLLQDSSATRWIKRANTAHKGKNRQPPSPLQIIVS